MTYQEIVQVSGLPYFSGSIAAWGESEIMVLFGDGVERAFSFTAFLGCDLGLYFVW